MIILAVLFLIAWLVFHSAIFFWLMVICGVIGVALIIAGAAGREVGGRRFWY